jgi:hypothetical protein
MSDPELARMPSWGSVDGQERRNERLREWPSSMDIAELVFLAVIGLVALVLITAG